MEEREATPRYTDLVKVHHARSILEARLVKSLLLGAGIPKVWIPDENLEAFELVAAQQLLRTTSVEVFVPLEFEERARAAIAEAREAGEALGEGPPRDAPASR